MNINIFWAAMVQMFGRPWITERGEQPNQMWKELIEGHDQETMTKVIDHFKWSGNPFPPNLSEVGLIVKTFKGSVHHGPARPVPEARPLPSEQEADKKIKDVLDCLQSGQKRRTAFLPGESFKSHQDARLEALKNGKTAAEFESDRLLKNGWTPADEARFLRWRSDIMKPQKRHEGSSGPSLPPKIPF
jgi:hypothetical protein